MEEKKLILNEQELLSTAGGFTEAEMETIRRRAEEAGHRLGTGNIVGLPVQGMRMTEAGWLLLLADGKEFALPASAVKVDLEGERVAYLLSAEDMSAELAAVLGLHR